MPLIGGFRLSLVLAQPQDMSPNSIRSGIRPLRGWKSRRSPEFVAYGFAMGYAIITYFQWQDLRQNFRVDERAWVKLDVVFPLGLTPTANKPTTIDGTITNFGKSTITDLNGEAIFEVVGAESAPSFNFNQTHSSSRMLPIFPGENFGFPIVLFDPATKQSRVLTGDEADALLSGRSYLATFGLIWYRDQFGLHWYRFCKWYSYGPEGGLANAETCVRWNRIGDDAPPKEVYGK